MVHRRRPSIAKHCMCITLAFCVVGFAAGCMRSDAATELTATVTAAVDIRLSERTPSPRPDGTPTAVPQEATDFTETTAELSIIVPTQPRGRSGDDALVSGTLTLSGRCLWIVPAPLYGGYVIICPEGTRVAVLDGQLSVVQPNGDVFAMVGDVITLGGGEWGGPSVEGCGAPAWGADF